jgi:hypothetical protein
MITAPDDYLAERFQPDFYYGVANPVPNSGFRLMAAQGQLRLYKITICQRASSPAAPVVAVGGG